MMFEMMYPVFKEKTWNNTGYQIKCAIKESVEAILIKKAFNIFSIFNN